MDDTSLNKEWEEDPLIESDILNVSDYGNYNITTTTIFGSLLTCDIVSPPQHILYHLANTCFLLSYIPPSKPRGLLFMHSLLILGFLLYSTWAWNVICAPDVFSWNFTCMLFNMGQTLYIAYQMRPVKIRKELQPLYQNMFEPLHVPRLLFKRLVSVEFAQLMYLHEGEAYAMSNLTKTDRLGLLIEGKANVLSSNHFLHSILPMEFLDSPEFESSRTSVESKFKVTVVAATSCRYLFWQRSSLEYLFVKEPYLSTVMSILIARDITTKLYNMNHKIVTEKGSQLDIRLPSLTSSLSSSLCDNVSHRSPTRRSPGSYLKSSEISLAASLSLLERKSQPSLRSSPDVHRSPLRHATLARRSTTQFSPKLIRNLETSTAGGKYLSYSSPPVSRYPSRMTMGCSLPASYKSENELLEEDEKGENEFLLTEHEGMIGKIV
ncbi:UNVERIFIED_CONTAM: hypothetical protein RMT77_007885 [Armadillidium vulgare]